MYLLIVGGGGEYKYLGGGGGGENEICPNMLRTVPEATVILKNVAQLHVLFCLG